MISFQKTLSQDFITTEMQLKTAMYSKRLGKLHRLLSLSMAQPPKSMQKLTFLKEVINYYQYTQLKLSVK